jgi:hypothetical protein
MGERYYLRLTTPAPSLACLPRPLQDSPLRSPGCTLRDTGHGIGTALSTQIEEEADVYAFLVDQLGMAAAPAPTAGRDTEKAPVTAQRGPEAARR